jgi:hypothetical protein
VLEELDAVKKLDIALEHDAVKVSAAIWRSGPPRDRLAT